MGVKVCVFGKYFVGFMKLKIDRYSRGCPVGVGIANCWGYAAARKSKGGSAIVGA